jgi:hypothetical protein
LSAPNWSRPLPRPIIIPDVMELETLAGAAARGRAVPVVISVSPFFGFVLGLVVPGALVVLLLALLSHPIRAPAKSRHHNHRR